MGSLIRAPNCNHNLDCCGFTSGLTDQLNRKTFISLLKQVFHNFCRYPFACIVPPLPLKNNNFVLITSVFPE